MSNVLLVSCPDRAGLVATVAGAIAGRGGNIVDADQHTDATHDRFLQRVEFDLPAEELTDFEAGFGAVAAELDMQWSLHRAGTRERIVVLVSRQGHCLLDLLGRSALGELPADIVAVVSNHDDHAAITDRFGIPFVLLEGEGRDAVSQALDSTLTDLSPDLVVLARYMQIVPPAVVERFSQRIINIHHSFLPAFVGAKPYHQAHERGVKIIGATAHYATEHLDEGPIICQDVTAVSHRDDVARLIRRGRDLEQVVLARAVQLHLEHRVLAYANRTVVFD